MTILSELGAHPFFNEVFEDGRKMLPEIDVAPSAIEMPEDVVLDEQQYYIQKVGFFLAHTLAWCRQLDLAIEFLSNFDYSKKITATRADHTIYNLENYLIRINSAYDRVLQLVNAVFHLGVSEEHVSHAVIISNAKVQHRPEIVSKVKAVQKYLKEYAQARHTLIHKHSYQDAKMRRLEIFYMHDLDSLNAAEEWKRNIRTFRTQYLKEFLAEKKEEFQAVNNGLGEIMNNLFVELNHEYKRQVAKLA
jgi:hypothetical protein